MKLHSVLSILLLVTTPAISQTKKAKDIEMLTQQWVGANNAQDMERISSLYAPALNFYAINKDKATCIKEKKAFFEKYPKYSISISNLDIDFYKSGIIKCNFVKSEVWNEEDRSPQQGYLLFEKEGNSYHIIAESDNRMDAQRGYVPQLGNKVQKSSNITYMLMGAGALLLIGGVIFLINRNKKEKLEPNTTPYSQPINSESITPTPLTADAMQEQIKGHEFERFVAKKFDEKYFQMITTRSDKKFDTHIPATNQDPDFEFVYKGPPRPVNFAIECKWRSNYFNNTIELGKQYQLDNYRNFQMRTGQPVFIILGVGGVPSQPNELYIIPLIEIEEFILSKEKLNRYYRHKKGNFFLEIQALKLQ